MKQSTRDQRLLAARSKLGRITAVRDAAIKKLVRCELMIPGLLKEIARLEKPPVQRKQKEVAVVVPTVTPSQVREVDVDDLAIPGFLKRDSQTADDIARAAFQREQDEKKAAKSRGRIAKLKAK